MTFWEHVKRAGAYAFLFGIFMVGFGVGAAIWSSSLSPVQTELGRVRDEREKAQAELNQVKSEYAIARATSLPVPAASGTVSATPTASPKSDQLVEEVRLTNGGSAAAFGGEILVSLVATPFEGNPLRHTVVAAINSPGRPTLAIDHKDVGYSVEYQAARKFQVVITAADTFDAKFRVSVIKQ